MNRQQRRAQQKNKQKPVTIKISPVMNKDSVKTMAEEVVKREVRQQYLKEEKNCTLDIDSTYLWALHSVYGWGAKRLKDFYRAVFLEHLRMRKHYEVDDLYPERMKLKEIGVDVESWYDEMFDSSGGIKEEPLV